MILEPGNHSVLLLDYQYLQLLTIRSHNTSSVVSHVITLSKASKIFGAPTLLTTAFSEQQDLISEVAQLFPGQVHPDRTSLNAMEDIQVENWIKNKGKKKLVMAGVWTEVCLQLTVLKALAAGYEVYIVTDASGGASLEEHQKAIEHMAEAGARLLTTWSYIHELDTKGEFTKLLKEGLDFHWEGQLRKYLLSRKMYTDVA